MEVRPWGGAEATVQMRGGAVEWNNDGFRDDRTMGFTNGPDMEGEEDCGTWGDAPVFG